jgi:hypothetical protein
MQMFIVKILVLRGRDESLENSGNVLNMLFLTKKSVEIEIQAY